MIYYRVNQAGHIEGFVFSSNPPQEQSGFWFLERADDSPLPYGATFYDAESNSILFMKTVEENGEEFQVIDNDKEPIYL